MADDDKKAREKAEKEVRDNKKLKETLKDQSKKDPKGFKKKWGF